MGLKNFCFSFRIPGLVLAILCPCTVSLGALWVPPPGASGHILWLQGLSLFPEEVGPLWGRPKTAVPKLWCQDSAAGASGGRQSRARLWEASLGPSSCASHPVAFVAAAVCSVARGRRATRSLLPTSPLPAGTSGANGCAAPGALSPIKSSRGSCSAPSSLGTAGLEDGPPDPILGSWAGLCPACFWYSSFTGRAKGLVSKSSAAQHPP